MGKWHVYLLFKLHDNPICIDDHILDFQLKFEFFYLKRIQIELNRKPKTQEYNYERGV